MAVVVLVLRLVVLLVDAVAEACQAEVPRRCLYREGASVIRRLLPQAAATTEC